MPVREPALACAAIRPSERHAIKSMPPIIWAEGESGASRDGRRLRVLSAAKRQPRICCCMRSNRSVGGIGR
jgi:hypothetical protein